MSRFCLKAEEGRKEDKIEILRSASANSLHLKSRRASFLRKKNATLQKLKSELILALWHFNTCSMYSFYANEVHLKCLKAVMQMIM